MQQDRETSLIVVGICSGSVGTHGEMKVRSFTDNPRRFSGGNTVIIGGKAHQIERARTIGRQLIVKFVDVDSPEEAQLLNNADICVEQESVEALPEGRYYHFQLLGMQVVTSSGHQLGVLAEILSTGSNDVYVVRGESEVLIPAISDVIVSVDVVLGEMIVDLPDGL